MSKDVVNFNAGPAALPRAALERAHAELFDFQGTGMSILEHSHRGKHYEAVHTEAQSLIKELLGAPAGYEVLFLGGGASQQFAMVPMNFLTANKSADYVVTGEWSKKALAEAKLLGKTRVAGTGEANGSFVRVPTQSELDLDASAAYVHMTTNNTIFGTQFHYVPATGSVPLFADMSSDIFWAPIDVSKFDLIYAGAQKNAGPAGVTIVLAKKSLIDTGSTTIPTIFRYKTHADAGSLYNTPPVYAIYLVRNVLQAVKADGGLPAMEKKNREKAELLYSAIDGSDGFYSSPVERASRSTMNVVFRLQSEELEKKFLKEAEGLGMVGLKGHRSVGGCRASIYNAVPVDGVRRLAELMSRFAKSTRA
ncbi:MAG: 3-phosphoserine/phosphohydroxythreonine transaminase [Deltaproteobacteria bacterium]|nr:3-phosphoserine/phosphohydroxythreonine transaminase [Deltaproteobacteria bacterium]